MDEQDGSGVRISNGRQFLSLKNDRRKASRYHDRDEVDISNRAKKGRPYGKVGNAYQSPGDYRKASMMKKISKLH